METGGTVEAGESQVEHESSEDRSAMGLVHASFGATGPRGERDLHIAPRVARETGESESGASGTHGSRGAPRPRSPARGADAAERGALLQRALQTSSRGLSAFAALLRAVMRAGFVGGPLLIFLVLLCFFLGAVFLHRQRAEGLDVSKAAGPPRTMVASGPRSPGRSPSASFQGGQDPLFTSRLSVAFSPVPSSRLLSTTRAPREGSIGQVSEADDIADEMPARQGSGDRVFCGDLIVPHGCECLLVVPVHAPAGNFPICDVNGREVLQASAGSSGPGAPWQLTVLTSFGEPLARCREARPGGGGGAQFHVSDAWEGRDEYFARLVQLEAHRYELSTKDGLLLCLSGNFQTRAVNVTNFRGDLLATTEPSGPSTSPGQASAYYRLRVAPLANVGQSLCALLCIGQILRPKP